MTKLNGIAIGKGKQSLGVGPGQVNRIWALEQAIVTRETVESKAGIAYHHDLLRCPEWQVQEIKRELE